jgi:ATP-dependent DNA helicase RecG
MLTDDELSLFLNDLESDRVERKRSLSDSQRDEIKQAICAFANDLPDHRKEGVIFLGVENDGKCAGLAIDDRLLTSLSDIRSEGNILPFPTLTVEKKTLQGCELVVIIVQPSDAPPVRHRGRTYVRVGPSTRIATVAEESRLSDKRRYHNLPFDIHPISLATLDDFDLDIFRRVYLPNAISPDVLAENQRTIEQQLASLRFVTREESESVPTVLGILTIGKDPRNFLPGAYIQFLRIDGTELGDPIKDQKEIDGPLPDLLRRLDEVLELNISTATDIVNGPTELKSPDYPLAALQQLARNSILHREYNYQITNTPVRIYWFNDRVEIYNPGGSFGQVTPERFGKPGFTDYRNPHIAEVMKNLDYVQRFGFGIPIALRELKKNNNPDPSFITNDGYTLIIVRRRS